MTIPSVHAVVTQFQHAEAEASRWQKAAVFAESRISPTVAAAKMFEEDVVLFGRSLARRRRFLSKLMLGLNFPVTAQMLVTMSLVGAALEATQMPTIASSSRRGVLREQATSSLVCLWESQVQLYMRAHQD